MLTGDVVDTILNLATFAFLGAVAWLMIRKLPGDTDHENRTRSPHGR